MMRNTFSSQEWLKLWEGKITNLSGFFARVDNISLCFDLEKALKKYNSVVNKLKSSLSQIIQIRYKIIKTLSAGKRKINVFSQNSADKIVYVLFGVNIFYVPCLLYNNKLVAIAYGGGIATEGAYSASEIIERYNI